VEPGDKIISSVTMKDRTYTMRIATSKDPSKTITTDYTLESRQAANETTAYFVLEHAPLRCGAYPPDGVCTFEDISMEVEGKLVTAPQWKPVKGGAYDCESKATVVDPKTIKFTWDATATASTTTVVAPPNLAPKWGMGAGNPGPEGTYAAVSDTGIIGWSCNASMSFRRRKTAANGDSALVSDLELRDGLSTGICKVAGISCHGEPVEVDGSKLKLANASKPGDCIYESLHAVANHARTGVTRLEYDHDKDVVSLTISLDYKVKHLELVIPLKKVAQGQGGVNGVVDKCVAKGWPIGNFTCESASTGRDCTKAKDAPDCSCGMMQCTDNAKITCESPKCCACCLSSCEDGNWQKVGYGSKKECCAQKPECCPL